MFCLLKSCQAQKRQVAFHHFTSCELGLSGTPSNSSWAVMSGAPSNSKLQSCLMPHRLQDKTPSLCDFSHWKRQALDSHCRPRSLNERKDKAGPAVGSRSLQQAWSLAPRGQRALGLPPKSRRHRQQITLTSALKKGGLTLLAYVGAFLGKRPGLAEAS